MAYIRNYYTTFSLYSKPFRKSPVQTTYDKLEYAYAQFRGIKILHLLMSDTIKSFLGMVCFIIACAVFLAVWSIPAPRADGFYHQAQDNVTSENNQH